MSISENFIRSMTFGQLHVLNELATRYVARRVIVPGKDVLDLGANVGFHAKDFAHHVGLGTVHMFEPNPDLWLNLISTPNSRLWPFAVGNKISVENFYLPEGEDQIGSLEDPSDFYTAPSTRILSVAQVTIDSLEELAQRSISFIKMDVERHEEKAFDGMLKLLGNQRPIVVFENNTLPIEAILKTVGYAVYSIMRHVSPDIVLANALAIPNERTGEMTAITPNKNDVLSLLTEVEDTLLAYDPSYERKIVAA